MSKRMFVLIATLTCTLLLPSIASAHVLVKDQAGSTGALLHIIPDDDPVAGEPATLFFDVRDPSIAKSGASTRLTIYDEQNKSLEVSSTLQGSSVSATYTFPRQGLYIIKLVIKQNGRTTHTFVESQRVSRGIINGETMPSAPAWAEVGIIFSGIAAVCAAIITFNRRKTISEYSKF